MSPFSSDSCHALTIGWLSNLDPAQHHRAWATTIQLCNGSTASNVTQVQLGNNATYLSCQNSVQWCNEADWTALEINATCVCCQSVKLVWCWCEELILCYNSSWLSSGRCLRCIWIITQLGLILNYWSSYRNKIGSCELYLASRPRHPRRKCIKITTTDTQTSRHINCSNVFVQNWTQHKRVKHEIEIVL